MQSGARCLGFGNRGRRSDRPSRRSRRLVGAIPRGFPWCDLAHCHAVTGGDQVLLRVPVGQRTGDPRSISRPEEESVAGCRVSLSSRPWRLPTELAQAGAR